ncbi:unnamed protein product [Rotaria sp. Silwood2]|nr:unnamed protein product [Rotaria sp. Silwood2]CAF2585511.1 unnamed protein product [Rotaria sp. Silwood2]CAF2851412.1 unnamed protein product [Rotaria sp. Silwood2]CAF2993404.1 unnamed protein product [Rotaria sp. Silwood2]CAF3963806.1 unnamed protein product [Rotaria sp. Silwood2]
MPISETRNRTNNYEQHKIIFADKNIITPNENDLYIKQLWIDIYNENLNEGAVQSNGTILWDCPCLGTQAIGPCSSQFRAAFSCYQSSNKEPKGSECMIEFMKMQNCFIRYPKLYNTNNHHSNKINKKETEIESNMKLMSHPEARRQRMNEARKKKE